MSQRLDPVHLAAAAGGLTLRVSEHAPDVRVISASGELDMITAPRLVEQIAAQLEASAVDHRLVLDLESLSFMGSSGLAALLGARRDADKRGVDLRLVCSSTAVLRPLRVTCLAGEFTIHATLADALAQS